SALHQEPRLTARQIARLIHPQNGASLQNPEGYDKTNAMLNRMVTERSLDKLARPHATLDFMYCLRRTRKPLKLSNFDHERACADVFIGFARTGLLEAWEYYPKVGLVEPDRGARVSGIRQHLYLEIDRSTEPLQRIDDKLTRYCALPGEFQVIF